MRCVLLAGLLVSLFASSTSAAEPTKDDCIDAHRLAQAHRRAGKLRAARTDLLVCASASCPAIVRDECSERLESLLRVQPTIVLEARDADGKELDEVAVELDGEAWLTKLDGTAVAVDPGEHMFAFHAGAATVTRSFILREGEQGRHETIVIGVPAAPVPAWSHDLPAPPPPSPERRRVPTWAWIAGAAVVVIGAGVATLLVVNGADPAAKPPPPAGGLGTVVVRSF